MDDAELRKLIERTALETRQHFDVTAEGMGGEIRQVAEGVLGNTERLDRVDGQLNRVDERLDRVETRLDRVDSRLDSIDSRLDSVDSRFDSVDSRLNSVDSHIDQLTEETRAGFSELSAKV